MKNIGKIFLHDFSHISQNVVAVVVIVGLCVLPSLYAWFNIFSNWDPYGPESTSNLKIAVISEDQGKEIAGQDINIGTDVLDGLRKNTSIGWCFPESRKAAMDGVYSGAYYAALIIPGDFTGNMISFIGGKVEHPKIEYYENDKKNAIAPKITSKAKSAVQEEVNSTFISTLTKTMITAGNAVSTGTEELLGTKGDGTVLSAAIANLQKADTELKMYIAVLDSAARISEAAQELIRLDQQMIPALQSSYTGGQALIDSTESALNYAGESESTVDQIFQQSLSAAGENLGLLRSAAAEDRQDLTAFGQRSAADLQNFSVQLQAVRNLFDSAASLVEGHSDLLDQKIEEKRTILNEMQNTLTALQADPTGSDAGALLDQLMAQTDAFQSGLTEIGTMASETVQPQSAALREEIRSALEQASSALQTYSGDADTLAPVLEKYRQLTEEGQGTLEHSKQLAEDLSSALEKLTADLQGLQNNAQYRMLLKMIREDPDSLGDFIASPVSLETEQIYKIDTYGSAMTPFYTVLALWVGALILVAIIHTEVKPSDGLPYRPYEQYFGRYLLFFLVGQMQTLITVMGDLLYIRIQCREPFLFWLAASVTSFVFTLFIYSLTVAFHNVGEALAVIIMVIQVAGAGGTFPIEVLPQVYQQIYRFLPFSYAMNSMRETIGGMQGNDYWIYLLKLCIYLVVSLVIGLFLGAPFRSLNRIVEKSKARTGLMI